MKNISTLLSLTALSMIISGCDVSSLTDKIPTDDTTKATQTTSTEEVENNETNVSQVEKFIHYALTINDGEPILGTLKYVDGELQDRENIEKLAQFMGQVQNGKYDLSFVVDNEENGTEAVVPESTVSLNTNVKQTGVFDSYYDYDDGYYHAGAERSYSSLNNDVIKDNVTGLEWYATGKEGTRAEAGDVCSAITVNDKEWRVPKIKELATLIKYDSLNPAIDSELENAILSGDTKANVWAYEYRLDSEEYAYYVDFGAGKLANQTNSMNYHIVCVTGSDETDQAKFEDKGSYILDSGHKLMWEDTSANTQAADYNETINHCEELTLGGYDDWRVPNISELITITDFTRSNNLRAEFDNAQRSGGGVWSSTPYAVDPENFVYTALETYGNTRNRDITNDKYVRCVRASE